METKDNVVNNQATPAFASVDESANVNANVNTNVNAAIGAQAKAAKPVEESTDPFAHGFPEWDIVPPQVVVRRR